jgi:hypothetical protein
MSPVTKRPETGAEGFITILASTVTPFAEKMSKTNRVVNRSINKIITAIPTKK